MHARGYRFSVPDRERLPIADAEGMAVLTAWLMQAPPLSMGK